MKYIIGAHCSMKNNLNYDGYFEETFAPVSIKEGVVVGYLWPDKEYLHQYEKDLLVPKEYSVEMLKHFGCEAFYSSAGYRMLAGYVVPEGLVKNNKLSISPEMIDSFIKFVMEENLQKLPITETSGKNRNLRNFNPSNLYGKKYIVIYRGVTPYGNAIYKIDFRKK